MLVWAGCLVLAGCGAATPAAAPSTTTAAPSTTVAVQLGGPQFCQQLVKAQQKLTATIPTLATAPQAANGLVATYQTLAGEAPAVIKAPIQDLATVIQGLASAASDPTAFEQQVTALQTKAGPDAEAIGTWVGMHCNAG